MTETPQKSGRKRVLLAAGSLLGIGAIAVAAAFTDFAHLNLGGGGFGGTDNTFDIKVVGTDQFGEPVPGTWQDANVEEGVDIAILGSGAITPGDTVSVDIPVKNASRLTPAILSLTMADNPAQASDAKMAEALRYSVSVEGVSVVQNVKQEEIQDLEVRRLSQQADVPLRIEVTLPDQGSKEANNAFQGLRHSVQAQINAESYK